ncbi:MAG TPA: NfeD family protein [Thermoanaerobaculia bacterium]|nr:NfeD family protein [Thermoanaerobaculia bacterium]
MTILWWHWLVLGLLLVLAELAAAGGFYIIFFGIAALLVGVLTVLGVAGPLWVQVLLFSGLSVGALLLFRSRLLKWLQMDPQAPTVDSLVGEVGIVDHDLPPDGVGKVEVRGSAWSARNATSSLLARGARCRVVRVEGLTLFVEPEGAR